MRSISARDANQGFSDLLSKVEQGEEVLITKRGRPVAVMSPFRAPEMTPEREKDIQRALALTKKGLPFGGRRFTRDEMHER